MKIVVAPDKFKGSLSGIEFCNAVEKGLKKAISNCEVVKMPLADGGDGTFEILNYHLKGEKMAITVKDPLFRPIKASYLFFKKSKTAFIEMAEASGMKLLSDKEQNCFYTTTYGTGLLISDAINRGAKNILLGIGGSATNDCGIGMAFALGYQFFDENDDEIIPIGKNLSKIKKINTDEVIPNLEEVNFEVACDVTNPLSGENGAAYVYAPQKGASAMEVVALDIGLRNMASLFKLKFGIDVQNIKGAGAAGGMGAGAVVFLKALLSPGIKLIKKLVDFDSKIEGADWIISGEGKLDEQTLSGKTMHGIIESANKRKIPVAAFCGSITLTKKEIGNLGIGYHKSIMEDALNLEDAMVNSAEYVKKISYDFAKSILK